MSSITNDPSAFFDSLENGDSSPEKQGNSYDALISGELDKEPSTAPATAKSDPAAFFDGLQKDSATADQPKDASAPSAFDQKLIASKGAPLDTETKKWLDMEDDPDQLQKIKETTPWVPLSDAQHRTLYEKMRHGGLSGALPSTQDVGNFIGQFLFTPAKAIGKIGKDLALSTLDAQNDPYFQEHPEDAPNPNVPKDIKDVVSAIPENIRDLNRTRRQVADGGTLLSDITQEGLGLHSYDDSFKNYLARERLHEHDAAYDANNPSTWGQTVDYLSPTYKPALAAIARYAGPDRESIKHEFANQITDEQASAIQDKRANDAAQQSIQDVVQSENEHPEDKDLQMLGSFLPMGNWFDVGGRAIGATGSGIKSLSQIGKTSEEINAAIKASMAAKAANPIGPIGKMMQGVGNAGGAVDRFGQKINQATENALSYIPGPVRPMLARHLPLAGIGAAAGAYEAEQNPGDLGSKALSFLKGFGGAEIAARVPRALEDVGDSVGVAAGGNTGAFKTAAINPDSAPFTRLTLKALGAGNPAVLDWIGNNAKDYAKSGVQMLPLAVAMGVAQSADPHEMGQILGSGLAYMGLGQAFHKALGTDPVTSQRIRSQNMADIQKTLSGMYPESQANLAHAMSWDNVIDASANRVKEATAEYQDAIAKKGEGSPEANEAAQNLANASRVHDMNQRANPQTRQEWAIQDAQTVADGSQLINGPLRAGKNVRIEALTTDQIAQKLMEANAGKITPEEAQQAAETGAGAFFSRHSDNRVIDPFKDAVVVNMDHVLTRQQMGEAFNDAFHHELGHAVEAIPEWRELNAGVREQLFGTEHRDAAGNLIAATPGVFDQKKLVDAFSNTYAKNLKNGVTEQQLAERLGLWDQANNRLNEPAVAKYMQEELLADINSHGISSHAERGSHPLLDWAITKQTNNRVARAVHKVLGLGGDDAFKSSETGLTVSPEILAAKRNAVRELKKLNGELSSSIPINGPANDFAKKFGLKERNGDTVSRSEMMANKALLEHYGKDSGLFKTEMQAIITDAQGNPVGAPIKISNPSAAEGSWTHTTDESGNPKITQTRGYGQIPDEIQGVTIPSGGQVHVENQFVYQPDGETPILNSPKDVKNILKARGTLIRDAIDNTPDVGAPNRFRAVSADGLTYKGTMTPLQIKAIQALPESIVPRSIKEKILTLNEAIARNDGSRFIGDYASRIDKNGRYVPFSSKHIDFIPVGMHFSKDGHFLVTTISVSRMFDKLAAWRDRMPARLAPWGGDAEKFFNEMVSDYLKNWQEGRKGAEGLDPDPQVAQAKANIYNDFLNIYDNANEGSNPDRTRLPKKTGKLTKEERRDNASSDANTIVRSRRLDAFADLIPHAGPKIPIDYEKAKINWMPARYSPAKDREEYPTSEEGLYSNLQKTIDAKIQGKAASPEQLKALINNPQSGIKQEEIKWTGVNDAIDRIAAENGGKVPKQALMDYLRNEGAVKLERVNPSGKEFTDDQISEGNFELRDYGVRAISRGNYVNLFKTGSHQAVDYDDLPPDAQDVYDRHFSEGPVGKYKHYSVPSGTNYQEHVLKITQNIAKQEADELQYRQSLKDKYGAGNVIRLATPEEIKKLDSLGKPIREAAQNSFTDTVHYPGLSGYVAHSRRADNVINGERGLLLEEMQATGHQRARKEGYRQDRDAELASLKQEMDSLPDDVGSEPKRLEIRQKMREVMAGPVGIPDMPFRSTGDWITQLFKRSLIDAVKDGKKWLGWVGGEEQADRYDLSKQVDRVEYTLNDDGTANFSAIGNDSFSDLMSKDHASKQDVAEALGKEVAESMFNDEGMEDESFGEGVKALTGHQLKVGDEKMKKFYDVQALNEIKKFLKKIDPSATVEQTEIPKESGEGFGLGGKPRKGDVPMVKIWKVSITPEIARVVKEQGLPQFSPAREESEKNLVAVHNTTEKKIEQALKIGGFAAPSMAIIRSDKSPYSSFGDITLVAHPDLVDPQANKHSRVFNADIYSPRYPSINYSLPADQAKKLWKAINEKLPDMPSGKKPFWSLDTDRRDKPINEELRNNYAVQMAFLNDTDNLDKVKWKLAENPRYQDNVDQAAIRDAVTPWGETEGIGKQYEAWLDNLISKNHISEKEEIFKGHTPSGSRKYIPHSLDNVVKMMTKTIRDGEGFSYGVPSIRSNVAKQFKAMKDIAKSREHVVTKEEMESLKKEVNEEFQELADKAMPMRQNQGRVGFGQLEAFSDDLKALADGDMAHLREMYPDGAPFQEWRVYLEKLRNLPTEYFESKIQRGVQLNEFSGAIVPDDTSEGMLSKLKGLGLQVRTYPAGDQEARQGAVRDLSGSMDVHFQPARNSQPSSANDAIEKALKVLEDIKREGAMRGASITPQPDKNRQ